MADFSLDNTLDADIARREKKIKFGSIGQDIDDEVLAIARATRSALDVMARRLEKLEDHTGYNLARAAPRVPARRRPQYPAASLDTRSAGS